MSDQSTLPDDRQRAEHFTTQGELRLLHGDSAGIDLFEAATVLDKDNSTMLYHQGLALFEYGSTPGREKALRLAARKFKSCTAIDPGFIDAWRAWGDLLSCQALLSGQWRFYEQAQERFAKALTLVHATRLQDDSRITLASWFCSFRTG